MLKNEINQDGSCGSKGKCYSCAYKGDNPGSAHIRCKFNWANSDKKPPVGNPHGIRKGWYIFPLNFDPTWMAEDCASFAERADPKMIRDKFDPLAEVAAILGSVGRW